MKTVVTIPDFQQKISGKKSYTRDIIDGTNILQVRVHQLDASVIFHINDNKSVVRLTEAKISSNTEEVVFRQAANGLHCIVSFIDAVSLLVDGIMNIYATSVLPPPIISTIFNSPAYSDLTVQVVGTTTPPLQLHLHKIILFKYSPVFKTMLLSGMTESVTNTILIDEFSVSVVRTFFRLMYAGADAIFALQHIDEVEEVWRMALMYDFKALVYRCEELLVSDINDKTCLSTLQVAFNHSRQFVKCKCIQYLSKNPTFTARQIFDMFGVEHGLQLLHTVCDNFH